MRSAGCPPHDPREVVIDKGSPDEARVIQCYRCCMRLGIEEFEQRVLDRMAEDLDAAAGIVAPDILPGSIMNAFNLPVSEKGSPMKVDDPELVAMASIIKVMADLSPRSQARVIDWLHQRFVPPVTNEEWIRSVTTPAFASEEG